MAALVDLAHWLPAVRSAATMRGKKKSCWPWAVLAVVSASVVSVGVVVSAGSIGSAASVVNMTVDVSDGIAVVTTAVVVNTVGDVRIGVVSVTPSVRLTSADSRLSLASVAVALVNTSGK